MATKITFLDNIDKEEIQKQVDNKVDQSQLSEAVDTALTDAKESGEFDGKDGISATHSWNGTTLTITSASGTSSADLKGDTGNSGVYVGSGDMPSDCNVQIDPEGAAFIIDQPYKERFKGYKKVSLDIKHDGFYNQYGAFTTDVSRSYAILNVEPNEQYKLTSFVQSGIIPAIIYKNANGGVIGFEKLGSGTAETLTDYEFIIPENCSNIIIQSANLYYELSLKKYVEEYENNSIVIKRNIVVKLGEELFTKEPTLTTGWSGSISEGFTHASGYEGELKFEYQKLIDVGEDYILEFDTTYTTDEFLEVGIGEASKTLVYNGTNHIIVPLKAIGGVNLFIKPYKDIAFTISNLSLKRIYDGGTEKKLELYTTLKDSNIENIGFWNVILGHNIMNDAIGSTRTIAIGNNTLAKFESGHRNIGVGTFAMSQMVSGEKNISIGADSMFTTKKANSCVAIGKGALSKGANLKHNIAIGESALVGGDDSTAIYNIAIGHLAGWACKGDRNIFIGRNNSQYFQTGLANICIGDESTVLNGKNQNTVIGQSAKATGSANRSIAIGYQAETTKANQCVIGGANITEFVLGTKKIIFNDDGTVTWENI